VHLREFACTAVLLAGFAGAAAAEEVMPFACRADGGRVLLSPGPMQSYSIVGAHERRNFTACSPARPNRCRSFDLHRFEIDCGGATVNWLAVVAALGPWTDRPYSIRGGRVRIEAGPRYYGAPMPCRVPVPYGPARLYGPRGFYGAPAFYGPRFMVVPCPGPAPRQFVNLPRGFAPIPARLVSFTSVPDPVAQAEAAPPLPLRKEASGAASAAKLAGREVAKKSEPEPSPSATLASVESETTGAIPAPVSKASGSARQNLLGAIGFGLASLLLFGTALLLSRRRSRAVQLAVPLSREPAGTLCRKTAPNSPQSPQALAPSPKLPADDESLPSTLVEALNVLGASPETGLDMLKILVKGLRRRWHPDHALNEEDRRARERKLKQINVAWDIVCGERRVRRSVIRPQPA